MTSSLYERTLYLNKDIDYIINSEIREYDLKSAGLSLIKEFRTRLTLTGRKFANYEGLCVVSPDGLLLIADSQHQYMGVLHDWFLFLFTK